MWWNERISRDEKQKKSDNSSGTQIMEIRVFFMLNLLFLDAIKKEMNRIRHIYWIFKCWHIFFIEKIYTKWIYSYPYNLLSKGFFHTKNDNHVISSCINFAYAVIARFFFPPSSYEIKKDTIIMVSCYYVICSYTSK